MKKNNRFEVLENAYIKGMRSAFIMRDTQTGVQYLYVASGNGGGLTPLLDADGKPVIDKSPETL